MRLVATDPVEPETESEIETVLLSPTQMDYLGQLSRDLDPAMPAAWGKPQAVLALLDRFEQAQLDLTAASSEEEITRVASAGLRRRRSGRR